MTPTPTVVQKEPVKENLKTLPSLVEMLMSTQLVTHKSIVKPKLIYSLLCIVLVKSQLQKLFPDEEEAVIQLALETTDFDLDKSKLILSNSQEREESYSTIKNLSLRYLVNYTIQSNFLLTVKYNYLN